MTNKQAQITINAIKFMLDNAQYSEDVEEALNMAINALTAQPEETHDKCTETHACDCVSRQAVQEIVDRIGGMYPYRQIGNRDSYSQYNEAWTDAINRVGAELNSLPSAQPEQSIAQERYEDLCEYFKDCSDQGRSILNDRKEFKSWLDRMKWHVMECDKLGRELEKLKTAQPEQRWIPSGEKPPEKGSYLVWMPFAPSKHRMTVAEYCGGYWNIKTPISAWMPLPEPYKEGADD